MVPLKGLVLMALPGLMVLGAEAGETPSDEDVTEVRLAADRTAYERRDARNRLGRRPLPEHDRQSIGRVGGKIVRLQQDYRPYRGYERRLPESDRRTLRAERPYDRRNNGFDRPFERYERRRDERVPRDRDVFEREFRERDRLNVEAQRKVSRGPA